MTPAAAAAAAAAESAALQTSLFTNVVVRNTAHCQADYVFQVVCLSVSRSVSRV